MSLRGKARPTALDPNKCTSTCFPQSLSATLCTVSRPISWCRHVVMDPQSDCS